MIRLHEGLKILVDLQAQGELELAQRIAAHYMLSLDNAELRFLYLSLTARLGQADQVMDHLEAYLETDSWFSSWFLQRDQAVMQLASLSRFQQILKACQDKEEQYWQSGVMQPLVQVPPAGSPPYPLLIAMHGNGGNTQRSAEYWACASQAGWLVFHPLAKRLVGYGLHWWNIHEENQEIITGQVAPIFQQYPVDPNRVIFGGFSKGGEVAMVLTLLGQFGAKGFITVGAGGYMHMDPELWKPLLTFPPPGLRGVAMYSPYDLQRVGDLDSIFGMLRSVGVDVRQERYYAEGHVFPEDFASRYQSAVQFILRLDEYPGPAVPNTIS